MKFFISVFLILYTNSLFAVYIEGKVVNSITKESIPFASIYIKHSAVGATANEDGEFSLRLKEVTANDTIVFSALGYRSVARYSMDITNVNPIVIELTPIVIDLPVVTITPIDSRQILSKAIEAFNTNYFTTDYALEAGLKQYSKTNGKFDRSLDCNILIYYPFHKKKKNILVKLVNGKSYDQSVYGNSMDYLNLWNLFEETKLIERLQQLYNGFSLFDSVYVDKYFDADSDYVNNINMVYTKNIEGKKKVTKISIHIEEKSFAIKALKMHGDRGYENDKEEVTINADGVKITKLPLYSSAEFNFRQLGDKWILSSVVAKLDVQYKVLKEKQATTHNQTNYVIIGVSNFIKENVKLPNRRDCLDLSTDLTKQLYNNHSLIDNVNIPIPLTKQEREFFINK